MDPQLLQLIQSIQNQQRGLATLSRSVDSLGKQIQNQIAAIGAQGTGGGTPPPSPEPTGFLDQLTNTIKGAFTNVANSFVLDLKEFVTLSDRLAGLGSDISVLGDSVVGLDGGLLTAAKNSSALLEMGFDPLNRQVLNLAGRMDVTGQSTAVLFGSIEKLVRQTDLSNSEIGDLATTVQQNSEETGVSTERIVKGLDSLSKSLDFLNIAGLSTEVQFLTVELQKGLPASLQALPGQLISGLVEGGEGLRSVLGVGGGRLEEILSMGTQGGPEFQLAIGELRDRLDKQIGLSQLSFAELEAIGPAFGGPQILNAIKQLDDAFKEGPPEANIQDAFDGSIKNLVNTLKEPLQFIASVLIENFVEFVKPIATFLNNNREKVIEVLTGVGDKLFKGILATATLLGNILKHTDKIIGVLVASKAGGSLIPLGVSLGMRGGPTGALIGGAVGLVASIAGGAFAADKVSKITDPITDGLGELKNLLQGANDLTEQQITEDRLSRISTPPERQQTDFELFIGNFMRESFTNLSMSQSGRAVIEERMLDALENIGNNQLGTTRAVIESSDDSVLRSNNLDG
jgi:methyl-accepting chemotaxis protein